ncbi:receptor-like protein kinase FERONIA [Euphorbia lathyris]|uniref:receptor-like protein kinase FERONIA n=1 Tax=Euphorbia lathyris TaxID=212925 RepID=UPI0033141F33
MEKTPTMNASCNLTSILLHLCISLHLMKPSLAATRHPYYVPSENIFLDCGSYYSQTSFFDGRNWSGDVRSKFLPSNSNTNSTVSTASSMANNPAGVPYIPYKTARLFYSNFTYTFNVTPGPKFVRLHFYPSVYSGFDPSKALLSVTDGDHHTLLSNFSASLAAQYKNVDYLFKEFIIQVPNHSLHLTFRPSDTFAFLNGIEIVSMPLHLYLPGEYTLLPFVGHPETSITLDNKSALETVYRINVAGIDISPKLDSGMFRTWTRDDPYIFGAGYGAEIFDFNLSVRYSPTVPPYTAPEMVYQTGRFMGPYAPINLNYNLSWFFPVETGFLYLFRLHFCELDRNTTKVNQRVFNIYINNETAEDQADIIAWSGGQGIPVYKDYVSMFPQVKEKIQDLWLELHPNHDNGLKPQYYDALLNGVEIFKLSNYAGDLSGSNPPQLQKSPVYPYSPTSKKIIARVVGYILGVVVLALIILFVWVRVSTEKRKKKKKISHDQSACQYFTIKEIKAATNNFDEARIIGTGGFGTVYKGVTQVGGAAIAVKRRNQASIEQGFDEFEAEIRTLSLLCHRNVVSLIGYCSDDHEMILVYEYMPNSTLFEHLHYVNQPHKSALSWVQRLQICIDAAQGLCYLHTGMEPPIIHRDVKTSNILLDDKWVAKIADFGLSKIGPTNRSTKIKGTIGYLDPEYCRLHILTEKSDIYSFGVVLLEVLSAKFVINSPAEEHVQYEEGEDTISFTEWALKMYETAQWDQLIDPHLEGNIAPASLAKFMEITQKCLAERGMDRPSITEVVGSLELVLELQMNEQTEDRNITLVSLGNSDKFQGVEFSEIMIPLGR